MKKLFALLALVAGAASAQSNLQFQGTVATSCALSVTQNGVLVVAPQNPNVMATTGAGSSGIVGVSYTGTPTVSVTLPTAFTSSPTLSFTPSFSSAVNSNALGSLTPTNSVASGTYSAGSSDTLTVNMQITTGSGDPFPTGNYAAVATVTCS